jgi:hypothetical protein
MQKLLQLRFVHSQSLRRLILEAAVIIVFIDRVPVYPPLLVKVSYYLSKIDILSPVTKIHIHTVLHGVH